MVACFFLSLGRGDGVFLISGLAAQQRAIRPLSSSTAGIRWHDSGWRWWAARAEAACSQTFNQHFSLIFSQNPATSTSCSTFAMFWLLI